ncbi:hypothetical protein [Deinococcus soli (ex Cha et al. 2016)]|uniref:Repeat protein (TIGR01451 family) n=2 Tax=Deinococcus soli (ex Cha et al. 2016) TaxID=1309411 RepID=A0AAE4BM66_9DEIO|nr:hypothetical protein [Deinococcus soli (ex Cha et al. 2016)]MDR6218182.1 putative repeat protein (TIGR01451 family) [Deinococcus soli (ex Cha et al. 2016)]MDR6328922.1 putative repeat protein (TIGR01451 family) [Deinococcus soli (ex Cha et al. 2016)]MDR6751590.1 putative repeat protein (TIGR01451 family) [Deinococcus soli (ex Cha et al. 2016)]
MRHLIPLTILALSGLAVAAQQLQVTLYRIVTINTQGTVQERREANPKGIRSGDILEQSVLLTNDREVPVKNARVTIPIPKNTTYITPNLHGALFSIDGGNVFAKEPLKELVTRNGRRVQEFVSPTRYTHVRFVIPELPARSRVELSFRVRAK